MGTMTQFDWPVRVYYEDTDGGGVVYHANYLKFMERARTEWLRSLGFEQTELKSQMRIMFVVRALTLQYLRPANFDDALMVATRLTRTGRSLLQFEQNHTARRYIAHAGHGRSGVHRCGTLQAGHYPNPYS